ncbi:hypothetical protein HY857_02140 [Candidatus Saccharibacteria bacterium]|nr:hypothetical protein [Candidatus Saccharibacteria bacterium]
MSINKNQKGFGVVELILIIVIVLGLGGIGWYVVNSNHKTQKQLDSLAKSSDTATKSSSSSTKSSSPTTSEFVFKEFGVKITLPDSLKGLTTDYKNGYLYLTADQYKKALRDCSSSDALDGSMGSFGSLLKKNGQYPSDPTIDDGQLLKQFPDFYIGIGLPNGAPCEDPDKYPDESAHAYEVGNSLAAALESAFKTTTLVQ